MHIQVHTHTYTHHTHIHKPYTHTGAFVNNQKFNCLLLGDQVSRKGALTGGYYDTRMSRLEQQRLVNEHASKLAEMEEEKAELKRQLENILLLGQRGRREEGEGIPQ